MMGWMKTMSMTTKHFRTDREDIVHEDVYIEEIDESGEGLRGTQQH
jgi:hypothetical protein